MADNSWSNAMMLGLNGDNSGSTKWKTTLGRHRKEMMFTYRVSMAEVQQPQFLKDLARDFAVIPHSFSKTWLMALLLHGDRNRRNSYDSSSLSMACIIYRIVNS